MICPEIGNSGGNAFIGGHVNNAVQLSKALFDRGHEITIVTTPHRHPDDQPNRGLEWAEVVCLPISGSYPSIKYGLQFTFKTSQKIRELHKIRKFDVYKHRTRFAFLNDYDIFNFLSCLLFY